MSGPPVHVGARRARIALGLLAGACLCLLPCLAIAAAAAPASVAGASASGRWRPPRHLTWYWQLQGRLRREHVDAYDVDGFGTPSWRVAQLHREGIRVICYVDVGTWESWRPDASRFPRSLLGRGNGWPGERWLDIRRLRALKPIMRSRLEMCERKGFDAVEPDNIEGYANDTGFPITARQQLRYDRWIARTAHSLHLAVLQKNDAAHAGRLHRLFDGALSEECRRFRECSSFEPYLREGKPVLDAEYSLRRGAFCAADGRAGMMGARFGLALDGATFRPCW